MPTPDNLPELSSQLRYYQDQLLRSLPGGDYYPVEDNGVINYQSAAGRIRFWTPELVGLRQKGNIAILDLDEPLSRFVWIKPEDGVEQLLDPLKVRIVASVVATSLDHQGFPLVQLEDEVEAYLASLNKGFKSEPFKASPAFRIRASRRRDFGEPVQVIRFVDDMYRVATSPQLPQPGGVLYSRHLRRLLPSRFVSAETKP